MRAHGLRLRATLESRSHGFATAIETSREALVCAAGEPSLAAAIDLDAAFYLVGSAMSAAALRHAEAAVGRAELPGGDRGVLADALAVASMVSFLNGDGLATERLDRALSAGGPGPAAAGLHLAAADRGPAADVDRAWARGGGDAGGPARRAP